MRKLSFQIITLLSVILLAGCGVSPTLSKVLRNEVYEGAYNSAGEYHGYGILIHNGIREKYEGEFRNGLRHGKGIAFQYGHNGQLSKHRYGMTWEGEFRDGDFYKGTITDADGRVESGVWKYKSDSYHAMGFKYVRMEEVNTTERVQKNETNEQSVSRQSGDLAASREKEEAATSKNKIGCPSGFLENFISGKCEKSIRITNRSREAPKPKPRAKKKRPPTTISSNSRKVIAASSGTGFAVSKDGFVVTNKHVIDGCKKVKIHHGGRTISADLVATDSANDVALLKAEFVPKRYFLMSRSGSSLLQEVYVAGYPFGKRLSSTVKVTKGIVSSLSGLGNNTNNIQIDAALQPGNSGGPIIDWKGNVVGVAVAKLDVLKAIKELGTVPENTNFGIKSKVVIDLLRKHNIRLERQNILPRTQGRLTSLISGATYYLSCWMTVAQIKRLMSKKVFFPDFAQ